VWSVVAYKEFQRLYGVRTIISYTFGVATVNSRPNEVDITGRMFSVDLQCFDRLRLAWHLRQSVFERNVF